MAPSHAVLGHGGDNSMPRLQITAPPATHCPFITMLGTGATADQATAFSRQWCQEAQKLNMPRLRTSPGISSSPRKWRPVLLTELAWGAEKQRTSKSRRNCSSATASLLNDAPYYATADCISSSLVPPKCYVMVQSN